MKQLAIFAVVAAVLCALSWPTSAGVVWDDPKYKGDRPDIPGPVVDQVKPDIPGMDGIIWPCARKGCPGWVQMPIERGYMWLDRIKRSKK